jgi:hypothetical protein
VVRSEVDRGAGLQLAQRGDPPCAEHPAGRLIQHLTQVAGHRGVTEQRGGRGGLFALLGIAAGAVPGPGHHVVAQAGEQRVDRADRRPFDEGQRTGGVAVLHSLERRHPPGRALHLDPQRPAQVLVRQPLGQHRQVAETEPQGAQHHLGGGRPATEAGQVEAEDGGADQAVHQVVAR